MRREMKVEVWGGDTCDRDLEHVPLMMQASISHHPSSIDLHIATS